MHKFDMLYVAVAVVVDLWMRNVCKCCVRTNGSTGNSSRIDNYMPFDTKVFHHIYKCSWAQTHTDTNTQQTSPTFDCRHCHWCRRRRSFHFVNCHFRMGCGVCVFVWFICVFCPSLLFGFVAIFFLFISLPGQFIHSFFFFARFIDTHIVSTCRRLTSWSWHCNCGGTVTDGCRR